MTKSPADLLERNRQWAEERTRADPDAFTRLKDGQSPRFLWIGCSDSRVPAATVTGLEPGEVFVHRNVANLVHSGDLSLLAVLQFSIDVLKVEHAIVCGHHNCGGVHAAVDDTDHGTIDHWLQPVRDAARGEPGLMEIEDGWERHTRLCEASVRAQVRRLADSPIVRGAWRRGQSLALHGWVYSLETGRLTDLECTRTGPEAAGQSSMS